MFKKIIIILIIFGFLLPNFGLGQQAPLNIEPPKTIDEAKRMTEEAIGTAEKELPGIIERIWKEEVMPIWKGMWRWFYNIWNRNINPRIEATWQRIQELLGKEIEKRKPIIKEEFEKEKQTIKQELPTAGQSLWDRLRELIK